MTEDLIFDVGMHQGEDTAFYLSKGYRVVAVDADPRLIERARVVFADAIRAQRLTLVPCAIGAEEGEVEFHLSEQTLWSSVKKGISTRDNLTSQTVRMRTRQLPDLFREYGVPFYCKIDIEGMDAVCLRTLTQTGDLPRLPSYISVESECLGDGEESSEDPLETLHRLNALGYTKFKLIDQMSLSVLNPTASVYRMRPSLWARARRRLGAGGYTHYSFWGMVEENRERLSALHGYSFPQGSSGPFGADLDGRWLDADDARDTLLRHRQDYFRMPGAGKYGFWCDWHATRSE